MLVKAEAIHKNKQVVGNKSKVMAQNSFLYTTEKQLKCRLNFWINMAEDLFWSLESPNNLRDVLPGLYWSCCSFSAQVVFGWNTIRHHLVEIKLLTRSLPNAKSLLQVNFVAAVTLKLIRFKLFLRSEILWKTLHCLYVLYFFRSVWSCLCLLLLSFIVICWRDAFL